MRRVVLKLGAEQSATGVSLMALMERVHTHGAIPPGGKCFLLMMNMTLRHKHARRYLIKRLNS